VDVPVVRRDGTLVLEDGWDSESGLLVQTGGRFAGRVPEDVSAEDARAALDVLLGPFRSFPLVGVESRGALLAALLTAVVRPSLATAPAFALDAPAAGSGKTLLASCIMALAGGGKLYAPLPVRDEAEVAKVLLSVLAEKPKAALFDNQVGILDSASLAAVLTSEMYGGRVLGSTRVVDLETNMVVLFTGNNLAVVGDMTRRIVTIRIDPECEAPALRRFDFDALAEVRERRDDMIVAALTLIRRAFSIRGVTRGRVGSFEMWDEIVGQTVAALGGHGFSDPADILRAGQAEDARAEEIGMLLHGLRDLFGGHWFTAADVVEALSARAAGSSAVQAVLDDIAPKGTSSVSISRILRFRRDTRIGDIRLLMRPSRSKKESSSFRIASDDEGSVVEFGTWREKKAAGRKRIEHLQS
jgi:hypothetical protein